MCNSIMGERVFTCTGSCGLDEVKRLLVFGVKNHEEVFKAKILLPAFDACGIPITALVLRRKTTLRHDDTHRRHPA
jgi:hypothetical protein